MGEEAVSDDTNDFDRIADAVEKGLLRLAACPFPGSDGLHIDPEAYAKGVSEIARAASWARGHAEARRP